MIVIDSLSNHPELVIEIVNIAWTEWGADLPEEDYARWLREAELDCRLNSGFSAGFVALDGAVAVGTVQLHEFDIDAFRDRSPWVCGMVVSPNYRGMNVGRRLMQALETFAREVGVKSLWVFTERAASFYEKCGWERYGEAVRGGESGVVLTKAM